MKIESSNVSMMSVREYSMHSMTSTSVTTGIQDKKDNMSGFFQNYLKQPVKSSSPETARSKSANIMALRHLLIRRILESLTGRNGLGNNGASSADPATNTLLDLRETGDGTDLGGGNVWERTIQTTSFFEEKEAVTFSSTGYANTSDGRTISFNVELSMSRSFTAEYTSFSTAQYLITDPLMIDVGNMGTSVTDAKFFFDLDCDGHEEEISFAGAGNGFLALDLNDDGIINDGSELFGTKSGNGFADLSKYDMDKNGWIDENDDIFGRLRVWTKDDDGNDILINLKDADVGAIYLGNVSTQFSLTNQTNYANAFVRSTGIFLKESGGCGTISQVDLTS